jgi:sortase B
MKKRRTITILILILGIAIMAYAANHMKEIKQISREAEDSYNTVRDQTVRHVSPLPAGSASLPAVGIPVLDIDYDSLEEINNDAIAWLYCPNTVIDYPVMKADDYSFYLTHLPDGGYNMNGSLFIDFNNAPDFSDPITVIYGHHMKSGNMFGSIVGYKKQEYYDEHPYIYLYTKQGNYRINLIYGFVIGAGEWRDRAFMYKENTDSLLAYAANNTTFESKADYLHGNRIVALSTCSFEFDNARYVVLGTLISEF